MFTDSEIDQPLCTDVPLSLVTKTLVTMEVFLLLLLQKIIYLLHFDTMTITDIGLTAYR